MMSVAALSVMLLLSCSLTPTTFGHEQPRPNFSLTELYHLQSRIFDTTIALNADVISPLLAPHIRGRVDITREFVGAELNTEYLFGLFAQLNKTKAFTLLGIPVSYTIVHFTGANDTAVSSTLMNFTSPFWTPSPAATFALEIHAWTQFDALGRVAQYDATFRHWDLFVSGALARVAAARFDNSLPAAVAYATRELARAVCGEHEAHCAGADRQYADAQACEDFLTAGVRFGEPHEMGRDTLLCRSVHAPMVALRPGVHCAHVGRSGGDMCTDALGYAERIDQGFWRESWMPPGW
ncbi:hypothetical protein B0J12DRAFT_648479 [Macrophomina phaseolina]|uniref:Uncharacterized protein n=1 Tax=Macrophomina phaseolina TaxID=35725 RepID=A0ABQ8GSA5_9PEZI|nr:hypothetical protein B0J12DRAFT_648479 [Macrophomina phaseolina]